MLEAVKFASWRANSEAEEIWHYYGASVVAMRGFKSRWRFVRMP
jgi:hypothetical protein